MISQKVKILKFNILIDEVETDKRIQYQDKSTKDDIGRQGVIQNRWLLEYLRLFVTYLG